MFCQSCNNRSIRQWRQHDSKTVHLRSIIDMILHTDAFNNLIILSPPFSLESNISFHMKQTSDYSQHLLFIKCSCKIPQRHIIYLSSRLKCLFFYKSWKDFVFLNIEIITLLKIKWSFPYILELFWRCSILCFFILNWTEKFIFVLLLLLVCWPLFELSYLLLHVLYRSCILHA